MPDEPAKPAAKKSGDKLDFGTIGGILVALGGILGGLIIEGGKIKDVSQLTAAMIVLGGTFGAVMVNTPLGTLARALKRFGSIFFEGAFAPREMVEEIIGYATRARKNGIVSLESEAERIKDPFLRKALNLAGRYRRLPG